MEKIEKMEKKQMKDDTSSSSAAALRDGGTPHSYPQLRGFRHTAILGFVTLWSLSR